MNFLQQRLAEVTDRVADLIAQSCELNELRERVRKAELSARRPRRLDRKNLGCFHRRANDHAPSSEVDFKYDQHSLILRRRTYRPT
jgi:hypothetical protein